MAISLDSKGQTLLSAVAGVAIATIALTGVVSMIRATGRYAKTVEARTEFSTLQSHVDLVLGNKDVCSKALMSDEKKADGSPDPKIAAFNPDDPSHPIDQLTHSIIIGNSAIASIGREVDALKIQSIGITEVDKNLRTKGPGSTTHLAKMNVVAERGNQALTQAKLSLVEFFYVETSPDHRIKCCGRKKEDCIAVASPTPTETPVPKVMDSFVTMWMDYGSPSNPAHGGVRLNGGIAKDTDYKVVIANSNGHTCGLMGLNGTLNYEGKRVPLPPMSIVGSPGTCAASGYQSYTLTKEMLAPLTQSGSIRSGLTMSFFSGAVSAPGVNHVQCATFCLYVHKAGENVPYYNCNATVCPVGCFTNRCGGGGIPTPNSWLAAF